jgi:hypothetical protein
MNLTRGIDLKKIADKMGGSSGAELKACCTEAGMFALRERRVHVTQEDFEMAVAKVGGGAGPRPLLRLCVWGGGAVQCEQSCSRLCVGGACCSRCGAPHAGDRCAAGHEEGLGQEHVAEEALEVEL